MPGARLALNVRDPDEGEGAAMPFRPAHTLAALLLEHADLRSARLALDDARDACAADDRRARHDFAAVLFDEEHVGERQFVTHLALDPVDRDRGAWRHLHLVPASVDNRVHA